MSRYTAEHPRIRGQTTIGAFALLAVIGFLSPMLGWGQALQNDTISEQMIVVIGAPGTDQYQRDFSDWGDAWRKLAEHQGWKLTMIQGDEASVTSRSQLQNALAELATNESSEAEPQQAASNPPASRLWIVLLGHGTSTGGNTKFNLVGPDVSPKELSAWLEPLARPTVIVNCSAASAPFLTELSRPGRMVLTATRSASEINFSRFGKYLAKSLMDMTVDIDHDAEISLLEAFLAATARTEKFYREEALLTTEHALLDDNGDRRGTSSDFYRGLQPVKAATKGETVDGQLAARLILFSSPEAPQLSPAQQLERQRIEVQLDALRAEKSRLDEQAYLHRLEELLLQLSAVYDAAES